MVDGEIQSLRYVFDGDGEMWELVNGERQEFADFWADSQVSSGWLSAAYRTMKDLEPDPAPKKVIDLTVAGPEDGDQGHPQADDAQCQVSAASGPACSGLTSTTTTRAAARSRSRSKARKWGLR